MNAPTVLVVHPDRIIAGVAAEILQHYGFNALPLTNAVDAIENVENLYFDVALVSNQMPSALPELLFQANRENWLEILLMDTPVASDVADFVLRVSEAVQERRWMCYLIAESWYEADFGVAGRPKNWREPCEQAKLRGEPDSYAELKARILSQGVS